MSIDRAAVASHLAYQFSALASEIGQAETDDSATGYGPDIDQALRQLAVDEAELATATVTDANRPAVLALAEYYCLRRMARQLALSSTDVTVGEMSQKLGQRAKTLASLIDEARATCAAVGWPVDGSPAWSSGSLNLDYLEPEPV